MKTISSSNHISDIISNSFPSKKNISPSSQHQKVLLLEGWAKAVGRPLMDLTPIVLIMMLGVILFFTFGLLNVIVAVVIERTLDVKAQNKHTIGRVLSECEKIIITSMADDFLSVAKEFGGAGNRELTFEGFSAALKDPRLMKKLDLLGFMLEDVGGSFRDRRDRGREGFIWIIVFLLYTKNFHFYKT